MSALNLVVKGMGHVPSKKNQRMAVQNSARPGLRIISRPESKEWCERLIRSFLYQLLSSSATTGTEISTEHLRQFLTASLPADDGWQHIPEMHITCRKVPKGEEGAEIRIERLD